MVIGFTVGVWDIFHEGHRNMLGKCKEKCDYLIVGIMTDYWVMVQKGKGRPYEALPYRIIGLRNSGLANKIVTLDTLDMTQYLQMVDVWFKGEDQKNMRPFDYPNIIYIPRTPNISTTMLLENHDG